MCVLEGVPSNQVYGFIVRSLSSREDLAGYGVCDIAYPTAIAPRELDLLAVGKLEEAS